MSATITIPTELASKVAKRAADKGVTLAEYVCEVLERDAEASAPGERFAPVRKQLKSRGTTDKELTARIEEAVAEVRKRRRV